MADNTIDTLSIEIQSSTSGVDKSIERLASVLGRLETKVSGLSNINLGNFSSSMRTLKDSMSGFFGVENFEKSVVAIRKLSNVNAEKMLNAAIGVSEISNALKGMSGIAIPSLEGIDKLIESTRKFGGKNVAQAVQNLPALSDYLTRFVTSLNGVGALTFDFTGVTSLVDNISRLGGAKATQAAANLKPLKDQLLRFVSGLNGIGALNFDTANLTNLVASISKLGSKSAGNAVPNIQALGVALKQLMATLSTAPAVSRNLIDMTNALANLASNGSKVSTAGRAMQNSLNGYSTSASRAVKSTRSLVSQIGLFYAKFFVLLRGAKGLGNAAKSAMDYIETLNYFNSAFRQVAENADVSDWQKYGYKSAEAYANSFEQRSKQLTQKLTGFNVDESGELTRTGLPSLGLDPDKVLQYQATFAQMASSMGVASETSLKLSNALTMIGGDLASVRNLGFEEVWEDMASGMVGMSRTLDKYGVNIRNVNLQQELYNLGIDRSIAKLNQQDKAVLRTIVLLNSTRYAWGDLANTINQPANSLRLLESNFASLARTLGSLFIPIITKVLPYINALVIALQRLFSWIGGLLGIKLSGFTSSVGGAAVDMGNFAESADDAAGGLDDAAKNAKKLNGYIADWHEVNNMTSDQGKGSGGGGAGGGGGIPELDAALEDALAEYQKAWDAAFANMENRANELADKVVDAFKRIWDTAEPTREALKRLWNEGLAQLGNFTWTALQDFWNEFLVPLGNWSLGTGFPMLIDAINNFLTSINWTDINDALRNFWQGLEPFAEKVGEGLIEFFDDLLQVGAGFINFTVPNGINALADALKKISPQTAKDIGYGLGILATSLVAFKGIKTIAAGIGTLSTNFGKFFKVAGVAKYGAIALGIGGVVLALDKFGYIDVDWGTLSSALKKLATALGKFAAGIGKGLISFIDGLLNVMSPGLEGLINGLAWALDGLGSIFNAIPDKAIEELTRVFSSFFTAWITYKGVISLIGGVKGALSAISPVIQNFGLIVEGIGATGSILDGLAYAFGPAALGGIAFTAIGGGLLLVANKMAQVTEEAAKNSAIGQFADAVKNLNDEVSQKTSQIQTSLANTRHDIETTGVAETQAAKDLADEYERLSSKANLSADDKERLKNVSERLVEIIPGLNGYIDDENGYLDVQKKTLDDLIKRKELYAQKQAAQEYLVQAYKGQYEAQMNAKNAIEKYNDAMDTYLENAGLAPEIINDVKNATLDLNQAQIDFENSPNAFAEKYGVKDMATLKEAYFGLSESVSEYRKTLDEAQETEKYAGEQIGFITDRINENTLAIQGLDEKELAAKKSTAEFQQKLSDLKSEFEGFGAIVSEEFFDKLALDDTGLADDVINMFDTLKNQTEISGEEVKQMFDRLGFDIPKEFAKNIAEQSPNVRMEFATLFANLSAGVSADSPALIKAFDVLGYELPQATIESLERQGANAQAGVIQLLGKIESGMKLAAPNLINVFEGLGIEVPTEMIAALASKDAEVQQQAIQLIAQIISGSESERPELIAQLNDLGVAGGDSLAKGIESKKQEANTSGANIVKESASGAITESKRTGAGTFEEAGQNAVDGYVGKLTSSDTKRKILQAGIEMAETALEGVKKGQNSNSPSKETAKLGGDAVDGYANSLSSSQARNAIMDAGISLAKKLMGGIDKAQELIPQCMATLAKYAVNGFNGGISNNMDSSYRLVEQWSDGLTERFGFVPEIDVSVPDYKSQYMKAMNPNIGNMSSTMRMELDAKMSQYAYETRQQNELLREQNELLRGIYNKPAIQGSDVFNAWQGEQRKLWNRAHITGVKGID